MKINRVIEVTTKIGCRLKCSYCPQSVITKSFHNVPAGISGRPGTMPYSAFVDYLRTVPSNVDIHFSGFSEPWHCSDCSSMIRFAHEAGHAVAVFTTADGMTRRDVEALHDIPFKRFVVHLPDRDGHMKLTPDDDYIELLLLLKERQINNLEFMTIGLLHPDVAARLGRTPSTRRVHSRAGNIKIYSSIVGTQFSADEISVRNANTSLICRANRMFSNVLLPNGDLQLCCMDYSLEYTIGNLGVQSYDEIVGGSQLREIFEMLNDPHSSLICRKCEYALPGRYTVACDA